MAHFTKELAICLHFYFFVRVELYLYEAYHIEKQKKITRKQNDLDHCFLFCSFVGGVFRFSLQKQKNKNILKTNNIFHRLSCVRACFFFCEVSCGFY